jgi:hypothetical protein
MAMMGQKTEEVYRRYAIVDEAMIREAAMMMDRGARARRELLHTELHDRRGRRERRRIIRKIEAVRWPRG